MISAGSRFDISGRSNILRTQLAERRGGIMPNWECKKRRETREKARNRTEIIGVLMNLGNSQPELADSAGARENFNEEA